MGPFALCKQMRSVSQRQTLMKNLELEDETKMLQTQDLQNVYEMPTTTYF